MTEDTMEWNLAFAHDEVITKVSTLLTESGYTYTRTEHGPEILFQVIAPQGTLLLVIRPLLSHRSPFNPQATLHRTLLMATWTGASNQDKETFRRRLTLTFLRVGG